MQDLRRSMSVGKAIWIGTAVVNVPVWLLLAAPAIAAALIPAGPWLVVALPAGFLLAWCWWSYAAPRWRLWAYERVQSTSQLRNEAVEAGLLWPQGSFFERTEFKSEALRQRQAELERRFP